MRTWSKPRQEIDFFVEIDGQTHDLEGILEDLDAAHNDDVRFHADPRGNMFLAQGVLTSLGGREYACSKGPNFDAFRKKMTMLLILARAEHGTVVLSDWVQGYVTGRKASEAYPYTAEEHLRDVAEVMDQIAPEMDRRAAYEARRLTQPEDDRDPPYTPPKKLVSAFWKVSYAVPRLRLTHSLDGSGMGNVTLEEMVERLMVEIAKTHAGWSWP